MTDSTAPDTQVEAGDAEKSPTGGKPGTQFETITSQDELDRIITTRLARERARYADYDDLKERAAKWDAAEEAQKTELQKALDRAAAAEKQAADAQAAATRASVLAKYQVPEEYQDLVTATDAEGMEAQAAKLQGLVKPAGPIISTQGKEPTVTPAGDDWIRAGFSRR